MVKSEYRLFGILLVLILFAVMLTSCGKSEFGVTTNTAKRMTITAEKADKDASFTVGTLEVADGEQIAISANLTKGSVKVEIIRVPAEQNIDELPEMDGEAVITANLKSTDGASGTVPAGNHQLRAAAIRRYVPDTRKIRLTCSLNWSAQLKTRLMNEVTDHAQTIRF